MVLYTVNTEMKETPSCNPGGLTVTARGGRKSATNGRTLRGQKPRLLPRSFRPFRYKLRQKRPASSGRPAEGGLGRSLTAWGTLRSEEVAFLPRETI